jgi:hypothetical protein
MPTTAEIIAEILENSESADPAEEAPAWALLFDSPFARSGDASSWIGGAPQAPRDFAWPRGKKGEALHFVAQIDLASLKPEPRTGKRPPGLPTEGALLAFIGQTPALRVLTAGQMKRAETAAPPADLGPIHELGYFAMGNAFLRRAITPVAFLDIGRWRPAFLPDPFKSPLDWIVNGGVAALEAQNVIDSLEVDLRLGADFMSRYASRTDKSNLEPHIHDEFRHYGVVLSKAPGLISALEVWRDLASSKPLDQEVDRDALREILDRRRALHDEMDARASKFIVAGNADAVWGKLVLNYRRLTNGEGYDELPTWSRPFVEMRETDWRGHRLFGNEPPFPNNWEDLYGHDCVISIAADSLLSTQSEHDYGFSIWHPRDKIAKGRYDVGRFVRHCAV